MLLLYKTTSDLFPERIPAKNHTNVTFVRSDFLSSNHFAIINCFTLVKNPTNAIFAIYHFDKLDIFKVKYSEITLFIMPYTNLKLSVWFQVTNMYITNKNHTLA